MQPNQINFMSSNALAPMWNPPLSEMLNYTKWALYIYQSFLCAFGCNLKRCKRAGRRKKSMKINGKKPAKGAVRKFAIFLAQRKSAKMFALAQVSPVAEWNTPLRCFWGRRESNLEKGLLKIEELEVADEEAGAQGGRGRHQALLQSEVMDVRSVLALLFPGLLLGCQVLRYCKKSQGFGS